MQRVPSRVHARLLLLSPNSVHGLAVAARQAYTFARTYHIFRVLSGLPSPRPPRRRERPRDLASALNDRARVHTCIPEHGAPYDEYPRAFPPVPCVCALARFSVSMRVYVHMCFWHVSRGHADGSGAGFSSHSEHEWEREYTSLYFTYVPWAWLCAYMRLEEGAIADWRARMQGMQLCGCVRARVFHNQPGGRESRASASNLRAWSYLKKYAR